MSAVKPVAALNVYKKVAIIRGSDDSLTFEDPEGNVKTINDLHLAAVATVRINIWILDRAKGKHLLLAGLF